MIVKGCIEIFKDMVNHEFDFRQIEDGCILYTVNHIDRIEEMFIPIAEALDLIKELMNGVGNDGNI